MSKSRGTKFVHELKWFGTGEHKGEHGRLDLRVFLDKHGLYVTSDDVPGLHLLVPVFAESRQTICAAIKRLFLNNRKMNVELFWRMRGSTTSQKDSANENAPGVVS